MLAGLGVEVTPLPFELHPWIPATGLTLEQRWGDRYEVALAMYARVEAECAAVGLPFVRPRLIPNTRRALQTASSVRIRAPAALPALHQSLYRAHFVEGAFLGDADVLDALVAAAGVDPAEVRAEVEAGAMADEVDDSMAAARALGVTGTPAWLVAGRVLVDGVRPRQAYEEVVHRLRQEGEGGAGTG